MSIYTGTILGIARKAKRGADPEKIAVANVTIETGIEGDARGKLKNAQISLISKQAWEAAMTDLCPTRQVDWSERRANVFVDGLDFEETTGAVLSVGDVKLEVMSETDPCETMNKAYPGLKDALTPNWRGGVRCRVLAGGTIKLGDTITMERN